jgi:hypothetical protein
MHSKPMSEDDWEARMDVDTLMRAKEIQGNPQRMSRAKDYAKQQAKVAGEAVESITDKGTDMLAQGYRKLGK